jgi:CubicO group peptidase (beta-lactamase class C family)
MTTRILGIVVALACSVSGTAGATTNLKRFDPVALQGVVEATAKNLLLPGALVLLRTPQGDFAFGYGTTELGGTIPPRADTHFRVGSNTKTMTAVVILQLAQEGKIDLDDPVSKYIPGVPNGDDIAISQLLKMRSGLYNYTDAPELSVSLDHNPTKAWTPEELLAIAFNRPPLFPPGTKFDYCNTNYALLGLIAEKLDGAPLAKVFENRLFGPLGIKHTLLPANTSNAIPEPYSHGYLYGSSSYALVDAPYPPTFRLRPRREHLSLMTTQDRILPMPQRPAGSSLLLIIWPHGCVLWSVAKFSMPIITASGSTAFSRRTQANLSARNMGMGSPKSPLGRTVCIFTVARCPATTRSWATILSTM